MSQRVAWSLKAVVVSVSLIVVTGLWLWSTLPSTDDARSALSEVLPEHAQIVNERIYRCNTDDGGGPFCGEDYVVLASPTSEQWGAEFVQTAVSHGYRVLADSAGGGREDVDMVRGKDEIYVIVPGSVQRHECLSQARADTTIAVWECAALVRYTRNFRPKTHF